MRIGTFTTDGAPLRACVVDDDAILDVSHLVPRISRVERQDGGVSGAADALTPLLGPRGQQALCDLLDDARTRRSCRRHEPGTVRLGPPVLRPGKVVVAARNHAGHVAESARVVSQDQQEAMVSSRTAPTGYLKAPSSLAGPQDPVSCVAGSTAMDYEIHLVVVIGSHARDVPPEDAMAYVAGYTVANNLNPRDVVLAELRQLGICVGMSIEGTTPIGPWVVTLDEIPDPDDVRLQCRVDGDIRQDASTAGLIFPVASLVAHFSKMGLEPGDLIFAGTPPGIAAAQDDPASSWLQPGSVVEAEADGIGQLTTHVLAAAPASV